MSFISQRSFIQPYYSSLHSFCYLFSCFPLSFPFLSAIRPSSQSRLIFIPSFIPFSLYLSLLCLSSLPSVLGNSVPSFFSVPIRFFPPWLILAPVIGLHFTCAAGNLSLHVLRLLIVVFSFRVVLLFYSFVSPCFFFRRHRFLLTFFPFFSA